MSYITRVGAVFATVVAAAALTIVGTGTAMADSDHGGDPGSGHGRAYGEGTAAGGLPFSFEVRRNTDGRVSGYFKGALLIKGNPAFAPEGPATCVSIQGNRVGFLYPLEGNTQPGLIADKGLAILISVQDNGPGQKDGAGFLGPLPIAAFGNGCDPGPTVLPITEGDVVVKD